MKCYIKKFCDRGGRSGRSILIGIPKINSVHIPEINYNNIVDLIVQSFIRTGVANKVALQVERK